MCSNQKNKEQFNWPVIAAAQNEGVDAIFAELTE